MCLTCDIKNLAGLSNADIKKLGNKDELISKIINFTEDELAIALGNVKKATKLKLFHKISCELYSHSFDKKELFDSPKKCAAYFRKHAFDEVEAIHVMYLDTKLHVIGEEVLAVGTVDAVLVRPREVLAKALRNNAVQIILVHNHPTGNPKPSNEDTLVAKRIEKAGNLIGIQMLDFIIVSSGDYTSFRQSGYIGN